MRTSAVLPVGPMSNATTTVPGTCSTVALRGIVGLTRTMALELAEDAIRVNAICPGYIATGLSAGRAVSEVDADEFDQRLDRARERMGQSQPLHRMGEADDIAAAVAWLASDDSAWVTGTEQVVDGGLTVGYEQGEEAMMLRLGPDGSEQWRFAVFHPPMILCPGTPLD